MKTMKAMGLIVLLTLGTISGPSFAQNQNTTQTNVVERFSEYKASSKSKIDFVVLSEVLQATVLPLGRSKSILGPEGKSRKFVNSNISFGNSSPSRYEGNRLFLHTMSEDYEIFYSDLIAGLENLSNQRSLSTFSKDTQLTYWLNLHNIIVIRELIREYPIRKLDGFKKGKKGSLAFWDQKVVTIEGVPLSLTDIERIVIGNWQSPLVIYGFFQGSIGGPTLSRNAFSSNNVWQQLETNAIEFVNSNRGARPKGSKMLVSKFYRWVAAAFDNSDQKILEHIKEFSDPGFHGDISGINQIYAGYYDWNVPDLAGGLLHGGLDVDPAKVLASRLNSFNQQYAFQAFLENNLGLRRAGLANMPQAGLELLADIFKNNNVPLLVSPPGSKECAEEGACGVTAALDKADK